jgi:AGCS family alanine or glycine:cation symporter
MNFSETLVAIVDIVWGTPLVIYLSVAGLFLTFYCGLAPVRFVVHAFKILVGKVHFKGDDTAEGQISHFEALSNALGATVGLGNIAGVAVAIYQGGPGAVFWMWVSALLGMSTKFFECTLAVMYRGKDYEGETQGGPMYFIEKAFPNFFGKIAALFFAVFGLMGTLALFQTNQTAAYLKTEFSVSPHLTGIVCAILTAVVLSGGLKRFAAFSSRVVPSMCLMYCLACLVILGMHVPEIPGMFISIFKEAFSLSSVGGGILGYLTSQVLLIGVKRAAFSNEAGMGTAPMIHGNSKTAEPVAEGLVAGLGPLIDTIIVCTMTALVIMTVRDQGISDSGIVLTTMAFKEHLGMAGVYILGIAIFFFSFSTMVGMAYYNEKCWNYIFKGNFLGTKAHLFLFCVTLYFGAIFTISDVINIIDIGFAMMCVPNLLAVLFLSPKVRSALMEYRKNTCDEAL